ncbi:MAG TPA: ribosome biogenesis/translation initiation ATPase RLI [archaeon]|nr:ribosome biogenesis/translation initiation ATPase RLI [archaeon]
MEKTGKVRIAVIDYDLCQPTKCGNYYCESVCPVNRTGKECISHLEGKQPVISETLCIGCKICLKCPFDAISIVNLQIDLKNPLHQYGENLFRVYRMPLPKEGAVVGLIGKNGIGKSTILKIASGNLVPNLGEFNEKTDWKKVIAHFKGKEVQAFFEKISVKGIKVSFKPQNIENLSQAVKGKVIELLEKVDEKKELKKIAETMHLTHLLEHNVSDLSGGELQRLAIAAAMLKEADVYAFDEPTSFLDVKERLNLSKAVRELSSKGKSVLVIEHDLAVLDYLSDYVHILFGDESVYGVVSGIKTVRNGINEYLEGFIKDENLKFRANEIKFDVRPASDIAKKTEFSSYPSLKKSFEKFSVEAGEGTFRTGEVIGILGPNAIGKTTFVKMLAGVLKPDEGEVSQNLKISYKPQYLTAEKDALVQELFMRKGIDKEFYNIEIRNRLGLHKLENKYLENLSGGELQRVSIALALSQEAEIFLLDEPSAYLDVEQRLQAAHCIRNLVEKKAKTAMVIDHDILFQDYVSDRLIVFEGISGKKGTAGKAVSKKTGMNLFLKNLEITFRRDPETGRPRANKPGSVLDQEQKKNNQYFYSK